MKERIVLLNEEPKRPTSLAKVKKLSLEEIDWATAEGERTIRQELLQMRKKLLRWEQGMESVIVLKEDTSK